MAVCLNGNQRQRQGQGALGPFRAREEIKALCTVRLWPAIAPGSHSWAPGGERWRGGPGTAPEAYWSYGVGISVWELGLRTVRLSSAHTVTLMVLLACITATISESIH